MNQDEIRFHGGEAYNLYPNVLKRISLDRTEKILDVGCGVGHLSEYLKGFNLHGCDVTESFVKQAKQKFYREVKVADIHNLPYEDGEFDKIICLGVFEYLEDPYGAMKELLRVCKGEIIINVPNYNSAGLRHFVFGTWNTLLVSIVQDQMLWTNRKFYRRLAKQHNLRLQIKYFSKTFESIRNLWGNVFAGDIIGIFSQEIKTVEIEHDCGCITANFKEGVIMKKKCESHDVNRKWVFLMLLHKKKLMEGKVEEK